MENPLIFGKYLLIDRVSLGGMAEVFKALALGQHGFQKVLAIKRVLPNISEDPGFVDMFVDEANIAGRLHHANIVQIYDLGVFEESYFIAMEFVEGRDLRAVFDKLKKTKKPLPADMAAFIAAQVLAGLDYAHRKKDSARRPLNIVHRDVSPPNILLSRDGEVKLIDFGIAKAAKKASKTKDGILKGKFGYMSPEQVRGMPVDARSDVFSVGVVLYEMLSGRRLFIGETDFATLEKVRGMEIEPPSNFKPDITEELNRAVMRALERDVGKRYQSAVEMQYDLQRHLFSRKPVFNESSLADWMQETFAADFAEGRRRMEEIERIDLEFYGIDIAAAEQAEVTSLRSDVIKARQGTDEGGEAFLPEAEDTGRDKHTRKSPTYAVYSDVPSVIPMATILAAILIMAAMVGFYLIGKVEARVHTLGNTGPSAEVTFNANEPGAEVSINGKTLCRTPCRIRDFRTGGYGMLFKKAGFLSDTVDFTVTEGERISVTGSLFTVGDVSGVLLVRSDHPGAKVYLDENAASELTPAVIKNVSAGESHALRVTMKGYKESTRQVRLGGDEFRLETFTLIPDSPVIREISVPEGAGITTTPL